MQYYHISCRERERERPSNSFWMTATQLPRNGPYDIRQLRADHLVARNTGSDSCFHRSTCSPSFGTVRRDNGYISRVFPRFVYPSTLTYCKQNVSRVSPIRYIYILSVGRSNCCKTYNIIFGPGENGLFLFFLSFDIHSVFSSWYKWRTCKYVCSDHGL